LELKKRDRVNSVFSRNPLSLMALDFIGLVWGLCYLIQIEHSGASSEKFVKAQVLPNYV
jgi:hypothetical protein